MDVLICGGGSAGLCAAVWLSRCGISYKILERRDGPLAMGQADGVQCRTVEVFESFGMSEDLLREAYHVIELAFWAPEVVADKNGSSNGHVNGHVGEEKKKAALSSSSSGIRRTHYAADVEPGISHQPHVILNQARMNALLAQEMERASGSSDILYGYEVKGEILPPRTTKHQHHHPPVTTTYCTDDTSLRQGTSRSRHPTHRRITFSALPFAAPISSSSFLRTLRSTLFYYSSSSSFLLLFFLLFFLLLHPSSSSIHPLPPSLPPSFPHPHPSPPSRVSSSYSSPTLLWPLNTHS